MTNQLRVNVVTYRCYAGVKIFRKLRKCASGIEIEATNTLMLSDPANGNALFIHIAGDETSMGFTVPPLMEVSGENVLTIFDQP